MNTEKSTNKIIKQRFVFIDATTEIVWSVWSSGRVESRCYVTQKSGYIVSGPAVERATLPEQVESCPGWG